MSFHHNPSAVASPDPVPSKPVNDTESVEAFLGLSCSDASRVSSIKDLRMKRVFTPEVNSVPVEEKEEENNEARKKLKVSDSGRVIVPGSDNLKVNELEVKDERNDFLNSKNQGTSGNGKTVINHSR